MEENRSVLSSELGQEPNNWNRASQIFQSLLKRICTIWGFLKCTCILLNVDLWFLGWALDSASLTCSQVIVKAAYLQTTFSVVRGQNIMLSSTFVHSLVQIFFCHLARTHEFTSLHLPVYLHALYICLN